MTMTLPYNMTKMRQNPFGSPPFLPFFRPPPCKVIRVNYAYNHIYVKPTFNKQR